MPFLPDLVDCWIFRLPDSPAATAASSPTFGPPAEPGRSVPGEPGPARLSSGSAADSSGSGRLEILLMRRSPGRILPGLWQCVSGSLEKGETVAAGALRELIEETGFGAGAIQAFYDLDQVNQFHEPSVGAVLTSAIFAVRVGPAAEPVLSHEHDDARWVTPEAALDLAIWPAYRESIRRIAENLVDPERAMWFELTLEGERARS